MTGHTPEPWFAVGRMVEAESHTLPDPACCMTEAYGQERLDPTGKIAEANARRIAACVNACQGIDPEAVPLLIEALDAMMRVQSKRRHPLGAPDEGIATMAAEAMDKARKALLRAGVKP